jgi:hypothetical protein
MRSRVKRWIARCEKLDKQTERDKAVEGVLSRRDVMVKKEGGEANSRQDGTVQGF